MRSFDRRIESLFEIHANKVKQQTIHILDWNLKDNVNAYEMQEDGSYKPCASPTECGMEPFDTQKKFFKVSMKEVMKTKLFEQKENVLEVDEVL